VHARSFLSFVCNSAVSELLLKISERRRITVPQASITALPFLESWRHQRSYEICLPPQDGQHKLFRRRFWQCLTRGLTETCMRCRRRRWCVVCGMKRIFGAPCRDLWSVATQKKMKRQKDHSRRLDGPTTNDLAISIVGTGSRKGSRRYALGTRELMNYIMSIKYTGELIHHSLHMTDATCQTRPGIQQNVFSVKKKSFCD